MKILARRLDGKVGHFGEIGTYPVTMYLSIAVHIVCNSLIIFLILFDAELASLHLLLRLD